MPVLWDKHTGTIVNNESAEIIRMFNDAFGGIGAQGPDYYPEDLRGEIDTVNAAVYEHVNNGVYKCGFAVKQAAYEAAVEALFATLDELEERLSRQRYLCGGQLTEADWRLFTTLLRFDPVYHGHFKCNLRRLADYPNLWNYTRELYQAPGVAATCNLEHIKRHYYESHESVNPTRIVPKGPAIDFAAPTTANGCPQGARGGSTSATSISSRPIARRRAPPGRRSTRSNVCRSTSCRPATRRSCRRARSSPGDG